MQLFNKYTGLLAVIAALSLGCATATKHPASSPPAHADSSPLAQATQQAIAEGTLPYFTGILIRSERIREERDFFFFWVRLTIASGRDATHGEDALPVIVFFWTTPPTSRNTEHLKQTLLIIQMLKRDGRQVEVHVAGTPPDEDGAPIKGSYIDPVRLDLRDPTSGQWIQVDLSYGDSQLRAAADAALSGIFPTAFKLGKKAAKGYLH